MNAGPPGDVIHVVQITDTHLLAEHGATAHGVDTFAALARIVDRIRTDAWRPALVLATGELSEDGSAGSYQRLRGLLLQLEVPIHRIPGNHDDVKAMQRHLAGGNIQLQRAVAQDAWRMVFLDSCVPGRAMAASTRRSWSRSSKRSMGAGSPTPWSCSTMGWFLSVLCLGVASRMPTRCSHCCAIWDHDTAPAP